MQQLGEKQEIMKNKFKLKGTDIYIKHDMSTAERERQREIRQTAAVERKKPKEVKVGFLGMEIEGKWITGMDLKKRTEEKQKIFLQNVDRVATE